MRKILFVGNGLNRVYGSKSWDDLLQELTQKSGFKDVNFWKNVPFTLVFEEIMNRFYRHTDLTYELIKKQIAEEYNKIETMASDDLRRELMKLPFDDILTTNYDYNLEHALFKFDSKQVRNGDSGYDNENKYSNYRWVQWEKKRIYHIHGEAKKPGTICLGYEHYISAVQNLRNLKKSGVDWQTIEQIEDGFTVSSKEEIKQEDLWLIRFLTSDIAFIGYGLDYSEIDIWWILTLRSTIKNNNPLLIKNRIVFYDVVTETNRKERNNLLEQFDVEVHVQVVTGFSKDNLVRAYQDIFRQIENDFKK